MIGLNAYDAGPATRMRTSPIAVERTTRPLVYRNLTSGNAGKMIPLVMQPLLREDAMSGQFMFQFKQDETVEILMNSVNVRILAYLVPKLAFQRFDGWDTLNRSYEGVTTGLLGNAVPPWFTPYTAPADPTTNEIFWTLGKHYKPGTILNTDYIEAYNAVWNFRAKNRSPHLALRTHLDTTLAPAFWNHQAWAHVVPDFDQAIIDGEVPLNVVGSQLEVKRKTNGGRVGLVPGGMQPPAIPNDSPLYSAAGGLSDGVNNISIDPLGSLYAELLDNGITLSLSNIELARKTQTFANLRRQYNGYSDDYIIDLLMDGINIPDEAWKQPMLLADESTIFGMAKRWATDGASLTESVVNGASAIEMRIRVPRCGPGGVLVIVAEIAPEQLFERQKDPYLHATDPQQLPQYLRDYLDPEKVQIVTNSEVDVLHSTPNGTFGYAPMNHQWAKSQPQVGGRFTRPDSGAAFNEARQRIWAAETENPVLGRDFYLVTEMNYAPFVVTDKALDHYEIMTMGAASIQGNTVFGQMLIESTDDYEKVLAEADQSRIDKTQADASADSGED